MVGQSAGEEGRGGDTLCGIPDETTVALRLGLYSSSSKRDVMNSRGEVSCVTFTIRVFKPNACVVSYRQSNHVSQADIDREEIECLMR